jgi:hypothetical protein
MIDIEQLKQQAVDLKLYGLLAHWHEISETHYPWLETWLNWEQTERKQRSLDRRLASAQLGQFKSLNEFDWQWPDKIDQQAIHRLMQLDFLTTASNTSYSAAMVWANQRLHKTWHIPPSCRDIRCYLPVRPICLMIWRRKMVIMHCGVD